MQKKTVLILIISIVVLGLAWLSINYFFAPEALTLNNTDINSFLNCMSVRELAYVDCSAITQNNHTICDDLHTPSDYDQCDAFYGIYDAAAKKSCPGLPKDEGVQIYCKAIISSDQSMCDELINFADDFDMNNTEVIASCKVFASGFVQAVENKNEDFCNKFEAGDFNDMCRAAVIHNAAICSAMQNDAILRCLLQRGVNSDTAERMSDCEVNGTFETVLCLQSLTE